MTDTLLTKNNLKFEFFSSEHLQESTSSSPTKETESFNVETDEQEYVDNSYFDSEFYNKSNHNIIVELVKKTKK